jgi:hypothetical protein
VFWAIEIERVSCYKFLTNSKEALMQMSNANVPAPSSGGSRPFYQIWIDALTKPNEQTYADIASSPNAKATTAYIWVFIGYLVEFFLTALVSSARTASLRNMFEQYGMGNGGGALGGGGGIVTTLVAAVCGGPILAVIATLFFAIGTALIQWVAKMFKGQGTNDQLVYAFAAISAPYAIVAGVLSLFAAIPFVGLCFNIVLALAGIYILVLTIMATKAVNRFGWGEAAGSVLIPFAVIFLVCCCLVAIASAAMGAAFKDIFQQIQSGLGG